MSSISLLVADDEPIVRAFLKRFIAGNGLPVSDIHEACNGHEAVEQFMLHKPDLTLMDIRMPGLDGLEAAREILEREPDALVVMVTAYDEFEYVRTALRAGVSDYLLKPLEHHAITRLIEKTLAGKEAREAAAHAGLHEHPLAAQVRSFVEERPDNQPRLEEIAAAVFMSPSHLSRSFHKHTGQTISSFVADIKKNKAIEFLAGGSLSVTEIAAALGFSSATYFTAWFKKATGKPPLQFRRDALESNPSGG